MAKFSASPVFDYWDEDEESYYFSCSWEGLELKLALSCTLLGPAQTGSGSEYFITVEEGSPCCGAPLKDKARGPDPDDPDGLLGGECLGCNSLTSVQGTPRGSLEVALLWENSMEGKPQTKPEPRFDAALETWCSSEAANPLELPLLTNTVGADLISFSQSLLKDLGWRWRLQEERDEAEAS